jgi:hypothetical protein
MGDSTILAVISIAATIVLGVWGIYLMIKRKYPGQITFVRESCLGLFDSIVKNMPDLAVQYKGTPVEKGLILLKGAFLNTGSKDISESMVEEKVSISLPENFRWLTAKVVSTSPKVQAHVEVFDRSVILETGLFRCREYVRFEALAILPDEDPHGKESGKTIEERLIKALTINHRIADTQKIKTKDLPPSAYRLKRFQKRFVAIGFLAIVGVAFVVSIFFMGMPAELRFLIPSGDGRTIEVRATPRVDGTLKVKGIEDKMYSKIVPVEQFFKTANIAIKVGRDSHTEALMIISLIIYIGLPLFSGAIFYWDHRQTKKLMQLLSISEEPKQPKTETKAVV